MHAHAIKMRQLLLIPIIAALCAFAPQEKTFGPSKQMGPMTLGLTPSTGHSFGRQFNGTNQALQSTSAVTMNTTRTLSVWFQMYQNANQSNDALALESSANTTSNSGGWLIDPNSASGACSASTFQFWVNIGGSVGKVSFAQPSAATWHDYLIVIDSHTTANFKAYVDGASQSLTVCTASTAGVANFVNFTVNVMSRNGASLWNAGRMAELAIYSVDESANVSTLHGGTLPSSVDSGNLIQYAHFCGTASPEPDTITGSWTLVGTPTQVAGPGVINCP